MIEYLQKVFMKKILHLILLFIFTLTLHAQKDSLNYIGAVPQQDIGRAPQRLTLLYIPFR